jgi:GNAT superfamily N-acetyltransferase
VTSAPEAAAFFTRGPAEIEESGRLVEKLFREEFDLTLAELLARYVETARWEYDESRDLLLTAEAAGRTVGTLLVLHDGPTPAPTVVFAWLAVEGPYRGHGIGRELLARAVETCRQRRLVRLRARSFALAPAAPHLYWMHGFRVVELSPVTISGRPRETILFEKLLTPQPER